MRRFQFQLGVALLAMALCVPATATTIYEDAVLADGASLYWSFNSQDATTGKVPEVVGGLSADAMSPLKAPGTAYPSGWRTVNNYYNGVNNLGDAFSVDWDTLKSTYYVANSSKTSAIASYAIDFWARRDTSDAAYLFAAANATRTAISTGYGGTGVVSVAGDGGTAANFAATSNGKWHHYAVVVDAAANTTTTILDGGSPITTSGTLNPLNWDGTMILGSNSWGASGLYWRGAIDELALYDLTGKPQSQIAAMADKLALHYTLASYDYRRTWPKVFDHTSSPEYYGQPLSPNSDWLGFQPLHPEIDPVNRPGAWYAWDWPQTLASYDRIVREGRPMSIFLDPHTAPLSGTSDPEALSKTLNYLSGKNYPLNYLFMDFEPVHEAAANADVTESVRQVRAHADSRINGARIGAYDYFTCDSIAYLPWANPSPTNMTKTNSSYASCGVNVSMPSIYPYATYAAHADPTVFADPDQRCPNTRAALFWAPLEKFSTAKRALPSGHEIIPWINDFVPADPGTTYEGVTPPTKADNAALLQHLRLRGADGYYTFRTMSENQPAPYDNEEYRGDMCEAWSGLDWLFAGLEPDEATFLNLTTDKHAGLQWSGAITDHGVAILVSNLGNAQTWFAMPDVPGFNNQLIDGFYINPGEHRLEIYHIPEPSPLSMVGSALAGGTLFQWMRKRRFAERPRQRVERCRRVAGSPWMRLVCFDSYHKEFEQ